MLFSKHDKIIFAGDSVTAAGRALPAGEGLFGAHGNGYVSYIAGFVDAVYPWMDLRVVNRGISGDRICELAARWQTDVLDDSPDWVAVMIGVNDVWRKFDSPHMRESHITTEEYRMTLTRLIEETLPKVKGMILMTPYYLEPNRSDPMRAELDERGAVVKELAEKYALPLADIQAAFDSFLKHMYPAAVAWDRVHPNYIGCALICKVFLDAVGFDWKGGVV